MIDNAVEESGDMILTFDEAAGDILVLEGNHKDDLAEGGIVLAA